MVKVILVHFILWILLSVIFLCFSEAITKLLFRGYHDVSIWLSVLIVGNGLILILTAISLIIALIKRKRNRREALNS